MPEKPVHHGRDHRPGGEDPIPFNEVPIVLPFVVISLSSEPAQAATADTPVTWDWTVVSGIGGGTVSIVTNDIDGTVNTSPGTNWTGNNFSIDFGSDAHTINIGAGQYMFYAHYWTSTLETSGPFWMNLFMDGTQYQYISPPGDHVSRYVNPASAYDGGNTFVHFSRPVVSPSAMTRKLVVTQGSDVTPTFDLAVFAAVRLGELS
jgi:hypothetical protein